MATATATAKAVFRELEATPSELIDLGSWRSTRSAFLFRANERAGNKLFGLAIPSTERGAIG